MSNRGLAIKRGGVFAEARFSPEFWKANFYGLCMIGYFLAYMVRMSTKSC